MKFHLSSPTQKLPPYQWDRSTGNIRQESISQRANENSTIYGKKSIYLDFLTFLILTLLNKSKFNISHNLSV